MSRSGANKLPPDSTPNAGAKLTLVQGGNFTPPPNRPFKTITVIFASITSVIILGTVIYLTSVHPVSPVAFPEQLLANLPEVYTQQGMDKFQVSKKALNDWVRETLNQPEHNKNYQTAKNIAVYLFPNLLPKEDFERSVAMTQWYSLELSIEKNNQSPQSRFDFEDLRSDIWNYENPEHESPQLTTYAKQVIRIYDVMSTF